MPADPLAQARDMAVAGGLVLAVAAPVAAGCAVAARQLGRRLVPRWRPRRSPWNGFDIVVLFASLQLLAPIAANALTSAGVLPLVYGPDTPPEQLQGVAPLWGMVVAVLGMLLTGWAILALIHERAWDPAATELPGRVALGTLAWAVVTPAVFAVYVLTLAAVRRLGVEPHQHPLTQLGVGGHLLDRLFFGLVVCFVTPLGEEFVFRGLMVRWAAERTYRPWALMAAAGLFATAGARGTQIRDPIVFVVILSLGLRLIPRYGRVAWPRFPVRTAAAVYASAAAFAAAHSAVWPTPVPLFALGLALGCLAARTGGIAACVTLHGLFNAVSFVYLLRGGT